MKQIGLILLAIVFMVIPLFSQNVEIPDNAFLNALIWEGVDTNGDNLISYEEADLITNLYVTFSNISDMTGIEAFVNLDTLDCSCNPIATFDVSNNTKLKYLDMTSYGPMGCGSSSITHLDLSKNSALEFLNWGNNDSLFKLDIASCTSLKYLDCSGNQLTSLDVSENTALELLSCSGNQLTSLDVSENTELTRLYCNENQLTSLDISNNSAIGSTDFQHTELNMGDNSPLNNVCVWTIPFPPDGVIIDTTGSPNVIFTKECGANYITIPDTAFLYALIDEGVDTNGDSLISYGEAEVITSLDINGTDVEPGNIKDLTGIEAFHNLDSLSCISTKISRLDVSENINLKWLDCRWNELSSLDVSENKELDLLECEGNQLSSLNASGCAKLVLLNCHNNLLASLDVSTDSSLRWLECGNNRLTSLDVSACVNLSSLACYNNLLTSLDVSTNVALEYLECGINRLSGLIISENTAMKDLECFDNQLTSLDVSANTALTKISCSRNQLSSLFVSANTELELLFCSSNQLTSLIVSNNTALRSLASGSNQLTGLDLSKNVLLGIIDIEDMPTLHEVCVWTTPFPPEGTWIESEGSPDVSFTITCATGVEEQQSDNSTIYPNPVRTLLSIYTANSDLYIIKITSLNGQVIFSTKMEGTTHQIDLSSFDKGVYFITIRSKDFVTTRKIIKL